jgi:signal transduction histidine kinase
MIVASTPARHRPTRRFRPGAYRPIGRGRASTPIAIVPGVDLARVSSSLQALLRVAFVATIAAAVVVDLWVIGDQWALERNTLRPSMLVTLAIAALGVACARWPKYVLPITVAVAVLSLLQTSHAPNVGLRIGVFTEFVVMPVLFGAVLSRKGYVRWLVALFVLFAAESVALRAEDKPIRAIVAMAMLVLLGAAAAAVVYIRLRDSERRTSIENARYNERLDLARELHDVVGHHVTGIVVLAQASRFTSGAEADSPADRALADIEAAGVETLTSVRRLIGLLRTDPTTATGPRLIDIQKLVEDLRSTHPSTDLIIDDTVRTDWVPADLAITVQRLVQEAATNVRRHGDPASLVRFTMSSDGRRFELTVTNRLLHAQVQDGYGLIGMRERVDALGGSFQAGPTVDGEWKVRAVLPIVEGAT